MKPENYLIKPIQAKANRSLRMCQENGFAFFQEVSQEEGCAKN